TSSSAINSVGSVVRRACMRNPANEEGPHEAALQGITGNRQRLTAGRRQVLGRHGGQSIGAGPLHAATGGDRRERQHLCIDGSVRLLRSSAGVGGGENAGSRHVHFAHVTTLDGRVRGQTCRSVARRQHTVVAVELGNRR